MTHISPTCTTSQPIDNETLEQIDKYIKHGHLNEEQLADLKQKFQSSPIVAKHFDFELLVAGLTNPFVEAAA